MTTLKFLGAAREVTGSCYLLQLNKSKYLLDCGMHQGGDAVKRLGKESFDFVPSELAGVILSHAHLDHSGLLPKLTAQGFNGPVHCTQGTTQLLKILLEDAASLYLRDLEHENIRRQRAGKRPKQAEYSINDVRTVLDRCTSLAYAQRAKLGDGIDLVFHDAGHILGSAIVELTLTDERGPKTLVFSGDLGNPDASLMYHYRCIEKADVVLLESTYGNRRHKPFTETIEEFRDILSEAEAMQGNIMIPAFAVGRTQELLFHLGKFYHEGLLKHWQVFLDSPMGTAVTEVYSQYMYQLDREDIALIRQNHGDSLTDFLPNLTITESVDESRAINDIQQGAIIIAGSGMCTGGRIRHHFKHRIWQPNSHIVFVGFQAEGTLGRLLVDGEKYIKLFGQPYTVQAKIHTLGGFSAHADQYDLLNWASHFNTQPRFYLVHGEFENMQILQKELQKQHHIYSEIPERCAEIEL